LVGCWLVQSTCPQARPPIIEAAAEPPSALPYEDIPAYWRQLDRFSHKVPATAAQGDVIKIRIRFPFDKITSIQANEWGAADSYEGNVGSDVPAHLEPTPDGQAYEVVPVLSQGNIHFRIGAIFKDRTTSAAHFDIQVGPPEAPPAAFYADRGVNLIHNPNSRVARLRLGDHMPLRPGAVFAVAPQLAVWLKSGVSFRVQPAEGEPTVSVDNTGNVTRLRTGRAVVDVALGKFVAPLVVEVYDPATQPALICSSGHFPVDPNDPHGDVKSRYQYCVTNHER
jgi:hypothetical protein